MEKNFKQEKELMKIKHGNTKELLQMKGKLIDHNHKKKAEYATFLYNLKNSYLEKTHMLSLKKIKYAFDLRNNKVVKNGTN